MTATVKSANGSGKRSCKVLVAAFGDAGHAFPAIGLARALSERGNEVMVETWERWREPVEALGIEFTAAEEYTTFPPTSEGQRGRRRGDAALALLPLMERERFDVVVSDILTLAPALAAERAGLRRATLIPHIYPVQEPGLPFFAFGALAPRTAVGRGLWRRALPMLIRGLEQGRDEMNETRAKVGPRADRPPSWRDFRGAGGRGDVPAARVSAGVAGGRARHRVVWLRAAVPRCGAARRRRAARARRGVHGAGPGLPR